jgi:hypothetical protein
VDAFDNLARRNVCTDIVGILRQIKKTKWKLLCG